MTFHRAVLATWLCLAAAGCHFSAERVRPSGGKAPSGCPTYPPYNCGGDPCSKEGLVCEWDNGEIYAECRNGALGYTHIEATTGLAQLHCGVDMSVPLDAGADLEVADLDVAD